MPPEATTPESKQGGELTPTTDLIPKSEVIARLLHSGLDPHTVASVLDLSLDEVTVEVARVRTTTAFTNPEDAQLADGMRTLASKAIKEAMLTLEYGSPAERHSLVKAIVGRAVGLIGIEQDTYYDEMRGTLDSLMAGMRAPGDHALDLPADDDYEAREDDAALALSGDSLHH